MKLLILEIIDLLNLLKLFELQELLMFELSQLLALCELLELFELFELEWRGRNHANPHPRMEVSKYERGSQGALPLPSAGVVYLYFTESVQKVVFAKRQFPQKIVNVFFILAVVEDKLNDLWGS